MTGSLSGSPAVAQSELSLVLSEFARTMLTDFPLQAILDALVQRIVGLLPVSGAGVTLIGEGDSPRYIAASDSRALRFERLQTTLGHGPCVVAHRTNAAVLVPDLGADEQFSAFGPHAVAAGLLAVFTFPLRHGEQRLGALDLYRDKVGPLNDADMVMAQTLADVAAAYLINAQAREQAEASVRRLHHLALHDALTGLPNRTLLQQRLARAAHTPSRGLTVVLFVDLDAFKTVNDTHGHRVGDDLLVAVARRLARLIRPGDTLARIAGDEFVLLYEDVSTNTDIDALAVRVESAFTAPFTLPRAELELTMTASIGIAHAGADSELEDSLIEEADLAMYEAKRLGGGAHRRADLRDTSFPGTRPRRERELRTALREGALQLVYQLIVACADRTIVGVEALLRWDHPTHGPLSPTGLIELAEQSTLIIDLGEWVLGQACTDHGRWLDTHPDTRLSLSVNVSARQLVAPDYVGSVARVLHRTAMDPTRLILEITENVFLEDSEHVSTVLHDLTALGVRLALDDFGTGFSCLSYLQRLPLSLIKIDQAFTTSIDDTSSGVVIIAAVTDLAHTLGLQVIVEGIETAHHHNEVTTLGCDYAQGYLYSRPTTAAAITTLLATR